MKEIVLICSGSTEASVKDKMIGWQDAKLSKEGLEKAYQAGLLLKKHGYIFDLAYTSVLTRGIQTLWQVMQGLDLYWVKVNKNWRLNARYYGQLEGLSYDEVIEAYGQEKFDRWINDYQAFVPLTSLDDPGHPSKDLRYQDLIAEELPVGENLQETFSRVYPHWDNKIKPMVTINRRVLVVAHHNSIRALMSMIEDVAIQEVVERSIPRCEPIIYRLDEDMKFIDKRNLL